jgi:hypothetical protein
MFTHDQLSNMSDEQIIRYILELTGYNDIIYVVNKTLEEDFITE